MVPKATAAEAKASALAVARAQAAVAFASTATAAEAADFARAVLEQAAARIRRLEAFIAAQHDVILAMNRAAAAAELAAEAQLAELQAENRELRTASMGGT